MNKEMNMNVNTPKDIACQGDRRPETRSALDELRNVVNRMEEAVQRVTERMEPIMRPSEPSPCSNKPQESYSSPLAVEMQRITNTIESLASLLADTIHRLEV